MLDIWEAWLAIMPALSSAEDFATYRLIRKTLCASKLEHPDQVLRCFIAFVGEENCTRILQRSLLGKGVPESVSKRIGLMTNGCAKSRVPAQPGTVDDLLDLLPVATRARIREYLMGVRHPVIPAPYSLHIARIARLNALPLRILGAMTIIGSTVDRRALATRGVLISNVERWDDIVPTSEWRDASVVSAAFDAYCAGTIRPVDTGVARISSSLAYRGALNSAENHAVLALGEDAHLIIDLLPPRHLQEADFCKSLYAKQRIIGKSARTGRIKSVTAVVPLLMSMQIGIENRILQLEGILASCMEKIGGSANLLDRNLRAGFEYVGPIVRADGSLGFGEQIVSFRFEFEGTLFERAHARDPDDYGLRLHLPRRPGGTDGFWGMNHKPRYWRRIHVVYEGTRPVEAGGESVEPFFADLFRWGMLEPEFRLDALVAQERKTRLQDAKLPHFTRPVEGLLTHVTSKRVIARYARGSDPATGDVLVPVIELYHAMAYARIAIRYGCRWGARIGEILQIRLGPDCFTKHRIGGHWKPCLALQPKSWLKLGKFGIDAGSAKAMRRVKEFTNRRWHAGLLNADGDTTLPVVPFGISVRDDLPEARYIFQCSDRALRPSELTMFARVLLIGIVDMRSHDGRYAFATALGLEGSDYEEIGYLLHHSPRSAMPAQYDLSALMLSDEAAERVHERLEAAMVGEVAYVG